MFEVNNGVTHINGAKGVYDDKLSDSSVKYGRNAVENHYTYMEQPLVADKMNVAPILDFSYTEEADKRNAEKLEKFINENDKYLAALPPLEFEYRYMPTKNVDTKAALGAAFEEMGGERELSVDEIDARFAPNHDYTSEALDINKDGKIDNGEYATSIFAADMFSKSTTPDYNNIDGTINSKGYNTVLEYAKRSNIAAATKLYSDIYNNYNLSDANKNFKTE